MQEVKQQAQQVETEVRSLCSSGKRDDAQQEAMTFAKEMMSNPDIQKIMECGKKMGDMMPPMPYMDQVNGSDDSVRHVCDQ